MRQYYYHDNRCPADNPDDARCVCWHDEGTGPLCKGVLDGIELALTWREKPEAPAETETLRAKVELFRKQNLELTAERDELLLATKDLGKWRTGYRAQLATAQAQVATLRKELEHGVSLMKNSINTYGYSNTMVLLIESHNKALAATEQTTK